MVNILDRFEGLSGLSGKALAPLQELLIAVNPGFSAKEVQTMSFSQLRDELLAIAPLDVEHVKAVNRAEARAAGSL